MSKEKTLAQRRKPAPYGEPMKWLKRHVDHNGYDCLPWPYAKDPGGYGRIRQNGKAACVSRVMCTMAYGQPSSKNMEAAHTCGNGHLACANPKHLTWVTPKENNAHKIKHGTLACGDKLPHTKLSESMVRKIRHMHKGGKCSQARLASQFGVAQPTISNIVRLKIWRHVT